MATSALIIIYLGSNFLKGREIFSSTNIYQTTYANSAGLGTSSPVLVNGVTVGRVRSVRVLPEQGYSTLVTFATEKSIKLTDATKARLISLSLLGEKAIDLTIEPGNPLKKLDAVPGEIEPGLGEAFMNTALPTLDDAKDVSRLASQFLVSMVENTDRINGVLANLEETTLKLRQTISANQKGVNQVTQNLTTFSSVLADNENGMGPLLVKLNQLMEGLEGREAKTAATKLTNVLGSLEQTVANLDQLLVDLKARPWRYVNFSIFGRKQGRQEIKGVE